MTHLGFVAILIGLLLLAARRRLLRRDPGRAPPPAVAGLVFVLLLVGFGSKAGIVPLHVWLPRAHPEAPSHVSALMSAAMVNLGVYGIVRVGFDLLGGGPRWWWLLVLALGALSAVYGILQAAVGTDLKRLLAYSTTENMGLVLVGIGAAGLFAATGDLVRGRAGADRRAAARHRPRRVQDAAVPRRRVGAARHRHPRPRRPRRAAPRHAGDHGGVRAGRAGRVGAAAGHGVRQRVVAAAVADPRAARPPGSPPRS